MAKQIYSFEINNMNRYRFNLLRNKTNTSYIQIGNLCMLLIDMRLKR